MLRTSLLLGSRFSEALALGRVNGVRDVIHIDHLDVYRTFIVHLNYLEILMYK